MQGSDCKVVMHAAESGAVCAEALLAGSNDFMANQTAFRQEMPSCSTPFSSPEEMAAYSAGLPTCLFHAS